jgi:hypothetical protein
VAKVDDKVRLQSVETWFDPMEMFRQIAPTGVVNRSFHVPIPGEDLSSQLFGDEDDEHGHAHPHLSATDASAACPFILKE